MLRSLLLPLGVLVVGVGIGLAMMGGHHPFAGMMVAGASVPLALVVWVVGGDRY